MSALAVVSEQPRTLEELTRLANSEHNGALAASRRTIDHAIRCGNLLLEIQQVVEFGGWQKWLDESWAGDDSVARCYIRIASYHDHIPQSAQSSIHRAQKALRGLPPVGFTESWNAIKKDIKEDARRLYKEGLSQREIAELFDVSKTAVARWVNPGAERAERRRRKERAKNEKAARRALREKERAAEVRKGLKQHEGTGLAESYSLTRKLAQALDRAEGEATGLEVRGLIREAHEALHRVEDALGNALRTPMEER